MDALIQRLYEDNVEGKISDERFAKLTAGYEAEQKALESQVADLQAFIAAAQESTVNVQRFLSLVRRYTDIQELTAEIIREFVEKIIVHQAEKIGGHRVQKVRIVRNCIGEVTVPEKTD